MSAATLVNQAHHLSWNEQSTDFFRSACGRFDLWKVPVGSTWLAIDWNAGKRFRGLDREACERWCRARLKAQGDGE